MVLSCNRTQKDDYYTNNNFQEFIQFFQNIENSSDNVLLAVDDTTDIDMGVDVKYGYGLDIVKSDSTYMIFHTAGVLGF